MTKRKVIRIQSDPLTARSIVRAYLEATGFDGLWTEDCGCGTGDLMPCGEFGANCQPAYVRMGDDDDEFPNEPYYGPTKVKK